MNITNKIFALKGIHPFRELRDSELAVIADTALPRHFDPGMPLWRAGKPLQYLYVTLEGAVRMKGGDAMNAVFDIDSLLFDRSFERDLVADQEGASCLLINKGHFYTMLYECTGLASTILRSAHGMSVK